MTRPAERLARKVDLGCTSRYLRPETKGPRISEEPWTARLVQVQDQHEVGKALRNLGTRCG